MSFGACEVAQRVGAAAIVTATFSGATARAVARNLPSQPIVAVSPNQRVVNQLALSLGRVPAARHTPARLRGRSCARPTTSCSRVASGSAATS